MFQKKALVLAALMASAAVAQAQVKVYGSIDMSVGSYKDFVFEDGEGGETVTKGKATTKVQSGNMMTSFIGFAGSEDLGGGLKAEYVLESFLNGDTGTNGPNLAGGFWGRGSYVALSGGFGKVALGQYDNAFFIMGLSYNPFGSSMMFSPTMVSYYSGGPLATLGYDTGWVNSITYETPVMAGFQATLQFAPKEVTTTGDAVKDHYSVAASYNAGPLSLMGVYTSSGDTSDGDDDVLLTTDAYFARQKNVGIGVSYDLGVAKLMGQFSKVKTDEGATDFVAKFFQIGASVPVSAAGSVLVSYGQTKYEDAGADAGKFKQYSIGYDHFISKRTDLYAAYTSKKLENVGSVGSFAVGIKHAF